MIAILMNMFEKNKILFALIFLMVIQQRAHEMECQIPVDASSVTKYTNTVSNKKRAFKSARKYFRDYCENSSIIGFKYLGERRTRGERLLWFVIVVTAIALSVYYILEIYNKYEENPFIVNFATRESPISVIPFPAVTICPVVKASRKNFNFTEAVHNILDDISISEDKMRKTQYMSSVCANNGDTYRQKLPLVDTFTEDFYDQLDSMKPNQHMMFVTCVMMDEEIYCVEKFNPIILDDGVCYSFNMLSREDIYKDNVVHYRDYHQNLYSTNWTNDDGYSKVIGADAYPYRAFLAGADSALEMLLMQIEGDLDYLCAKDTEGFKVVLHTPHTVPRLKKQYIPVSWDSSLQVMVHPKMMTTSKEVKKFKPKDRLCYFSDERPLKYFKIYNPENCELECLTNYTLKMCDCVDFYMPRDNSTKICGNSKRRCVKRSLHDIKEFELTSLLDGIFDVDSTCNCMPLCTEISYDVETSSTLYSWKKQMQAERAITFLEEMYLLNVSELHISKLSIFFKRDKFLTSQRNELYGPFDFLANFGGLLGLFTGFSLLSAVEIFYFLTVRLWCNFMLDSNF